MEHINDYSLVIHSVVLSELYKYNYEIGVGNVTISVDVSSDHVTICWSCDFQSTCLEHQKTHYMFPFISHLSLCWNL